MTAPVASAALDLTAIGLARGGGMAVSAALAAAKAGARAAFVPGATAPAPDAALALAMRRSGVVLHAAATDAHLLLVRAAHTLLLESALWRTPEDAASASRAAAVARAAGRLVALALADPAAVHRQRQSLLAFLRGHADLLLCNALEACALYDTHRVDTAVPLLRRDCPAALLHRGPRGTIVVTAEGVEVLDGAAGRSLDGAYAARLLLARQAAHGSPIRARRAGRTAGQAGGAAG